MLNIHKSPTAKTLLSKSNNENLRAGRRLTAQCQQCRRRFSRMDYGAHGFARANHYFCPIMIQKVSDCCFAV
jgi:hypothetical protein